MNARQRCTSRLNSHGIALIASAEQLPFHEACEFGFWAAVRENDPTDGCISDTTLGLTQNPTEDEIKKIEGCDSQKQPDGQKIGARARRTGPAGYVGDEDKHQEHN